ncbi:hypothetical protein BD779DRAFT_1431472, partial [Infundibulicybe gibba]
YFFKGSSIALDASLPGVEKKTLLAIPRLNPGLLHLELSGFSKIPDSAFASVVLKLSSLRTLVLRGSIKVGVDTMRAASKCCDLKKLNINYTSVSPVSLLPLLLACPNLEVLKLAGIQNWTDATFNHLNAGMGDTVQLPHLHTLKLRQTSLSDNSLSSFVSRCPSLERLDMSFTPVRRLANIILPTSLSYINKLSLTSTAVAIKDLISLLPHLIQLQNLSLGALGKGTSMTDGGLREMIPVLEPLQLSSISLVGNIRLGISSSAANSAILCFFRSVGRKCKASHSSKLGLTHLRASDLEGLIPLAADDVSLLENLILNNTGVDDSAAPFLASCPHLVTLGVAGTKITREGLFPILDSCAQLQNLDLTSCRGVSVTDRRRFFEVRIPSHPGQASHSVFSRGMGKGKGSLMYLFDWMLKVIFNSFITSTTWLSRWDTLGVD